MYRKIFYLLISISFFSLNNYAQKITGTILDSKTNEAIIGANVYIKGTNSAVVTDINGKFELNISQPLPVTLTVSLIGFTEQEVIVSNTDKTFVVKLRP